MGSAIEGIHHTALKHSRRAVRLWRESAELLRQAGPGSALSGETFNKAAELNARAADECRKALNTMEFLKNYRLDC